jgi:hypothetical protein
VAERRACPHRARRLFDGQHHRAAQGDGEVQPRHVVQAMAQVDAVVDEVDAPHETDLAVHHAQLVVQAPELPRLEPGIPAVDRPEHRQRHRLAVPPAAQGRQVGPAAEAVHHHAHAHAPAAGGGQRIGHPPGRIVLMEDVGGQPDVVLGRFDGRHHGGEQAVAARQQLDVVAAEEQGARVGIPVGEIRGAVGARPAHEAAVRGHRGSVRGPVSILGPVSAIWNLPLGAQG